jgi:hypothetical protein
MRSRLGILIAGIVALAFVVVAFTTSERLGPDGCPHDRDLMTVGPAYAAGDPGYERVSEAAAVVAREQGYDPLTEDDLRRIQEAAAHPIRTSPDGTITIDPNLRDTDAVVGLVIQVQRNPAGRYWPGGSSFCARVLSGDD